MNLKAIGVSSAVSIFFVLIVSIFLSQQTSEQNLNPQKPPLIAVNHEQTQQKTANQNVLESLQTTFMVTKFPEASGTPNQEELSQTPLVTAQVLPQSSSKSIIPFKDKLEKPNVTTVTTPKTEKIGLVKLLKNKLKNPEAITATTPTVTPIVSNPSTRSLSISKPNLSELLQLHGDVSWSELNKRLLELEQERIDMTEKFVQELSVPVEQHLDTIQKTENPEKRTISPPTPTESEISWAIVGNQMVELEQQRKNAITLLRNEAKAKEVK